MTRLSYVMALAAVVSFAGMSTMAFADEEKKKEEKKPGQVVLMDDQGKKDEQKDKGGK